MSYNFLTTDSFDKEIKRLGKKYNSLKNDLRTLKEELLKNPVAGTSLGNDCYKVRMAIKSKNKGKSAGARVITYVKVVNETIYLLTIFDKSEKTDISDNEIRTLLNEIDF